MTADSVRLAALVPAMADLRILIVGDVILDEYLVGRPSRLSREAPVPVLEFQDRFCRAGGAANPALNICAFGSTADLVSIVGQDRSAEALRDELIQAGLNLDGLIGATVRTASKTRLLAQNNSFPQHVARLDYPSARPDSATRSALAERLRALAGQADAILVSDYRGGVIDADTVQVVKDIARQRQILTCVDSQGSLDLFSGLDLVKCNRSEAEAAMSAQLDSDAQIERAGIKLLTSLKARYFVLTRGSDGLSVFERGRSPIHLPAANRTEVFDVAGAAATVIATLCLALVAGASLVDAAQLANTAAGLVVRRLGVVAVSPEELVTALSEQFPNGSNG